MDLTPGPGGTTLRVSTIEPASLQPLAGSRPGIPPSKDRPMNRFSLRNFALAAGTLLVSFALVGCEQKGPMEKAGENVDQAGKDLKDAVNPKGPMEKAGEKIDNATH